MLLGPTYEAQNNGPAGPSPVAMGLTQISRKLEDCFIAKVAILDMTNVLHEFNAHMFLHISV